MKLKHITRVTKHKHKYDAWLVRVRKNGKLYSSYFADSHFGTTAAALKAALAFRDATYHHLGIQAEPGHTPASTAARADSLVHAALSLPRAERASILAALAASLSSAE